MSKIIILVDWNVHDREFFLESEFSKLKTKVHLIGMRNYNAKDRIIKYRKILLWLKYLSMSIDGIRFTSRNDLIICWNFVVGALTSFINKLFCLNRKIVSLNMILHKKGIFNTLIRKIIYEFALNSSNILCSVNDNELLSIYGRTLNINEKNFFILPDSVNSKYKSLPFSEGNGYVFSGGEAARDWNSLIKAAYLLPKIPFFFIARKKYFPKNITLPRNVNVLFDVSHKMFFQILEDSSLVVLPLKSHAPAGLIVLIRSALMTKPVIATSTPCIKNYIDDRKTGILCNMFDYRSLTFQIKQLMEDINLRRKLAENLKTYIIDNYSEDKYVERIYLTLREHSWI